MNTMDEQMWEETGENRRPLRLLRIRRWTLLFVCPALLVAVLYFLMPAAGNPDPRVKLEQTILLGNASSLKILTVVDARGTKRYVKYPSLRNEQYDRARNLPGKQVDTPPDIGDSRGVGSYQRKPDSVMSIQSQISGLVRGTERVSRYAKGQRVGWVWTLLVVGCAFLVLSLGSPWVRRVAAGGGPWQSEQRRDGENRQ